MEWLASILTVVLKFGADWLQGWYAAERAEADRWAARTREGQLASLRRAQGDSQAAAAAAAAATAPADPAAWNRPGGALPALLLALLVCPGCLGRTVYVPSALPVLQPPPRPAVPIEPSQWSERERILAGYAAALEALVLEHNRRARQQNANHGY